MVKKVANSGSAIALLRAATTEQGIPTASAPGGTLICLFHGDRFTVDAQAERIAGVVG